MYHAVIIYIICIQYIQCIHIILDRCKVSSNLYCYLYQIWFHFQSILSTHPLAPWWVLTLQLIKQQNIVGFLLHLMCKTIISLMNASYLNNLYLIIYDFILLFDKIPWLHLLKMIYSDQQNDYSTYFNNDMITAHTLFLLCLCKLFSLCDSILSLTFVHFFFCCN